MRDVEVRRCCVAILGYRVKHIDARAACEPSDWLISGGNHLGTGCRVRHQRRHGKRSHRSTILGDREADHWLPAGIQSHALDGIRNRGHAGNDCRVIRGGDRDSVVGHDVGRAVAQRALAVVSFGTANVAGIDTVQRSACTIREVNTIVAGAASHTVGHVLPVVAIGGLHRGTAGSGCSTRVADGAIVSFLREANLVEALAQTRTLCVVSCGVVSAMPIQVVAGLGQLVAHVELVNHARVEEG